MSIFAGEVIEAHTISGKEVLMLDTTDVWQAVEDALNFCRVRMELSPYYSEPSKFECGSGEDLCGNVSYVL